MNAPGLALSPPPDDDDVHALKDHLPPGEAVLWTGRPLPGHAAWSGVPGPTHAARVAFMVLGAVAVTPFVVAGAYICWTAARSFFEFERMEVVLGAPLLFTFGFVIAVAPPYLLARPRLRHLHLAKATRYVLTSSHARVLLLRGDEVDDQAAVALSGIQGAEVRYPRADGSGDVLLHPAPGRGGGSETEHGALAFVAVADAGAVQTRVAEAIAAVRGDLAAL